MIPTKNKCYNLSIHGNIKNPIHDVFVQGTVYFFYQGSFRRFIFDVDWNYCGFFKGNRREFVTLSTCFFYKLFIYLNIGSLTSFFMAKAAKQFNKNFPNLVHPCPYSGIVFLPNFDPAVLVDGVAPKFIPDGLYKLTVRFHTPNNNVTMLLIEATGAMTILKKKGKSDLNTTLSLFL